MQQVRLTLDEVRVLAKAALTRAGCNEANARAVADTVTRAERDHAKSHGLFRIPGYVKSLANGKINGTATPVLNKLGPAIVQVDGNLGLAPLALEVGHDPLVECARETGIAALAIRRTHHYAALWPETEALAEKGLVGMAFVNSPPYVAPAGGSKRLFGTNPMSFAWPRKGRPPMVWDQASAAMARGELQIASRDDHAVPEGVGLDADGHATVDPAAILAGAQLPFGGYKGGAIALMVDLLCGPLIGEVSSVEAGEQDNGDGGPATGGELLIAISPDRLGGEDPVGRAERVFEGMLAQTGVRLPGDRRLAARERTPTEGVEVPASLHRTLIELAGH